MSTEMYSCYNNNNKRRRFYLEVTLYFTYAQITHDTLIARQTTDDRYNDCRKLSQVQYVYDTACDMMHVAWNQFYDICICIYITFNLCL